MTGIDDLVQLVEGLGAPYGLERSAKLSDGEIADERCLISLHRSALGADPAQRLTDLTETLRAPGRLAAAINEALPGADVVHFGHEASGCSAIRKLYFEYAGQTRRAMARRQPVLVHLAYKWRVDNQDMAITRYVWRPCDSTAQAQARIAERLPEALAPRAHAAATALLGRSAAFADAGGLPILDVEEPGAPRRSLDMNVYDADLTIADVAGLIADTAAAFAIPAARLDAVFAPARARALGHLAAGLDRREREFVTYYFGVEARNP